LGSHDDENHYSCGVTALLAFSAGFWTQSTLATTALVAQTGVPTTISPADLIVDWMLMNSRFSKSIISIEI
jgi:hypothetical protein